MEKLKLVDKYIVKQLLETFLIGIIIFTSIMFASDAFITIVKQISTYGISFNIAILLIMLKLPSVLLFTIPMGVLFSTVMTINKMSINSEISVMRACGISLTRLARPVLVFGLSATIISFVIGELIVPIANTQAKNLTILALNQKNIPDGKENFSFKELKAGSRLKRLFYVANTKKKVLQGVTVLDMSKDNTIQVIQSKYGKTSPDYWMFNEGVIYSISKSGKVLNTTIFDSLKLFNSINIADKINKLKAKELSLFKLINYIKKNKNENNDLRELLIELHEKTSIPITAFVFTLIGLPLAITPPRVRFNAGFLFSMLIIFLYYLIRALSISLGETGILIPFLAAWMPNLIIGSVGLFMFYKKAYEI